MVEEEGNRNSLVDKDINEYIKTNNESSTLNRKTKDIIFKIVILVLLVIALAGVGVLIYFVVKKKDDNKKDLGESGINLKFHKSYHFNFKLTV